MRYALDVTNEHEGVRYSDRELGLAARVLSRLGFLPGEMRALLADQILSLPPRAVVTVELPEGIDIEVTAMGVGTHDVQVAA